MKALAVMMAALALGACARKQVELPRTELPPKPQSSYVKPERLTDLEANECMKVSPAERNVCRKVEKNAEIAEDQQTFVDRLYTARDGK